MYHKTTIVGLGRVKLISPIHNLLGFTKISFHFKGLSLSAFTSKNAWILKCLWNRSQVSTLSSMAAKIESERGRKIYPLRLAIVEPVFANIRTHKRMDHFTLRGKRKVNIQWVLYCMIHNIEKILKYGLSFGFT